MKLTKPSIAAMAVILYFIISCNETGNLQDTKQEKLKNSYAKDIVNTFIKQYIKSDTIRMSMSSNLPMWGQCAKETKDKYNLDIDFVDTSTYPDTVLWDSKIVPHAKLLTMKEEKVISGEDSYTHIQAIDDEKDAFYRFGRPVFSKDMKYAAIAISFYCGMQCGNGAIFIYEHTNNGWVLKEERCNYIS
ncbi:hypothetical protein N180_13590 [Pedobacter antarcticus 4BY]|uniref:Lipoprotein n=2 Tax=Pedobacter antarcticus TaxID=34086 RepID=A0A081PE61_9SPHI|nr:hypothetical protein [Pedobacter antarcticus]KEQ28984.1 hypothetical protein N180_13590 [Pedobacter antarcticus 4BY]SFF45976.1 hypothetical protein SAMN03003324_03987 [Pedobacter antarcticus]